MAIALSPHEEFEYVLRADRELHPDDQTAWILQQLSNSQRAELEDRQAQGVFDEGGGVAGFTYKAGSIRIEKVRAGLRGCRNFKDRHGAEVQYEADKLATVLGKKCPKAPTAEFLERIAPADMEELAEAIDVGSTLTAAEGNG